MHGDLYFLSAQNEIHSRCSLIYPAKLFRPARAHAFLPRGRAKFSDYVRTM